MAHDRFIRFEDKPVPKGGLGDFHTLIEDFIGSAGDVAWNEAQCRFYIALEGHPSHPERNLTERGATRQKVMLGDSGHVRRRWIEVFVGDHIDVITRDMDPFTSAVADGLVGSIVEMFGGTCDAPETDGA